MCRSVHYIRALQHGSQPKKLKSWSLVSDIISDIQRYYIYNVGGRAISLDFWTGQGHSLYAFIQQICRIGRKVKYIPLKYSQNQGPILCMTLHKKGGVASPKWWHQDIFSLHRTPFVGRCLFGCNFWFLSKRGAVSPWVLACLLGVLYLPSPTLFLAPLC